MSNVGIHPFSKHSSCIKSSVCAYTVYVGMFGRPTMLLPLRDNNGCGRIAAVTTRVNSGRHASRTQRARSSQPTGHALHQPARVRLIRRDATHAHSDLICTRDPTKEINCCRRARAPQCVHIRCCLATATTSSGDQTCRRTRCRRTLSPACRSCVA